MSDTEKSRGAARGSRGALPKPPMHCVHSTSSLEGLPVVGCAFCAFDVIVRLLWNELADGTGCDGDCEEDGERPYPICHAMRVLGWGQHFTRNRFQKYAMRGSK